MNEGCMYEIMSMNGTPLFISCDSILITGLLIGFFCGIFLLLIIKSLFHKENDGKDMEETK